VLGEILTRALTRVFFLEVVMVKSGRGKMHKGRGASHFRHDAHRTHGLNMKLSPRRGGWRL
jgi:hypothetical protein